MAPPNPKTPPGFREDLKPDRLVAVEDEVLALWEAEKTFEASLAARKGAKAWVFYDGPATANGKPGLHHLISRSIKDFACRRKTMEGFLVERKGGWDTHGLPVEIEAEKTLGLEGKDAIERMGIAAFNRTCRDSVLKYLAEWERFTKRTGYWVDLASAYVTCSNEYIESLWAIFADLHAKGLLFKGHKVLPYCPRCETPLSSHEVGLGFQDVQDPSVFVLFRAVAEDGSEMPEAFLVWTTTPWTLPSNVALAVHPDVEYVKVRLAEGGGKTQVLWLAAPRLASLKAKPEQVEVLERAKGSALVGRRYRRLLDYYDVASTPNAFTVRPATFVTTEDGTGIVHMAPAYGEDDAAVGRRDGLPPLHPVDGRGRFVTAPRAGLVAGQFVKDADKAILHDLKAKGLLFRQETIVHSYPHCWRCDTPLLYYARDSWYLRTTAFREKMMELNAKTAWYPASTGAGRLGEWLANNVDWAISRDRYWGTPLPLWICDEPKCRTETAVGSLGSLQRLAGRLPRTTSGGPASGLVDLHRPYVDELTWACAVPGCGGTMRRTPEIADVWFDSGSMPFAQWHYPFENREKVEREVPADFIAEGVDQTRGWFYVLLAVGTMYAGKPAYKACVSNDMVLDAKGKKMSKSRGNAVDPMAVVAKYGADVVRWHLLTSRPVWLPIRFDEKDLVEVRNRFFGTLANVYGFFALYANADGFVADSESVGVEPKPKDAFDRWLLSRLDGLVRDVSADLDAYETSKAGKRIADFVVEDLSNWYVRRNRRRFWKGALTDDKREGYAALRAALTTVARLVAPLSPFFADALHRALTGKSVHLAAWPTAKEPASDADRTAREELETGMDLARTLVSLGHAARHMAGIKVRQPVQVLYVFLPHGVAEASVLEHAPALREELNLKAEPGVAFLASIPGRIRIALNKKVAAPRLGADTQPAAAALAALDADAARRFAEGLAYARGRDPGEKTRISVVTAAGRAVTLAAEEVSVTAEDVAGAYAFDRGVFVMLDARLTPELVREGMAREFLHGLQALRKSKGFQVTDRVRLEWAAGGALGDAIRAHAKMIADEVLATQMVEAPALADGADVIDVDGTEARVVLTVVPG